MVCGAIRGMSTGRTPVHRGGASFRKRRPVRTEENMPSSGCGLRTTVQPRRRASASTSQALCPLTTSTSSTPALRHRATTRARTLAKLPRGRRGLKRFILVEKPAAGMRPVQKRSLMSASMSFNCFGCRFIREKPRRRLSTGTPDAPCRAWPPPRRNGPCTRQAASSARPCPTKGHCSPWPAHAPSRSHWAH